MDKLDLILQKLDSVEAKVDSLEKRMDSMEKRMDSMEKRMDSMEKRMDSMEKRMDSMEKRIDSMEKRMEEKFLKLDLRMDNEILFGLRVVADGHFDLNRKLNAVMDDHTTKEQMYIRMIHISSELQKIQNHCKHCA